MSVSNQVYYLDSWKLDNPSTQEPSNNNLFNISFSRPVVDSNNYLFKTDCLTVSCRRCYGGLYWYYLHQCGDIMI